LLILSQTDTDGMLYSVCLLAVNITADKTTSFHNFNPFSPNRAIKGASVCICVLTAL